MNLSILCALALLGATAINQPASIGVAETVATQGSPTLAKESIDQSKAVAKTIRQFAQAGDERNLDLLASVMHPTGSLHYQDDKGVQHLDAATYRKLLGDGIIGGTARKVSIGTIAIDGDLASAKARFDGDAATFEQFFSLLLVDEKWIIVGVIARMTPKG